MDATKTPRSWTRRPLFWVALTVLSAASAAFAVVYFDEAFPVVGVELEMSRAQALSSARERADHAGWGPDGYRQAASFGQPDGRVRTYVELEGGGSEAFARLGREGLYHPYQWRVRHFAEGAATEVEIRFTPAGTPYGFELTLPEDEPGASLPAPRARALAEEAARTGWGVELAEYDALEASQTERPGGRVDHTFVYQRTDTEGVDLGEARVRVRLGVAGERLSEVTHFVHVPEAFLRSYEERRATNNTIAVVSEIVFILLFLVVGCGVGTFFLLRDGWVLWRKPLAWGAAIALLLAGSWLNRIPQAWMDYETAISSELFVLQHVGVAVGILVLGTPFLAFVFMAAESLTRRAFPGQLQQWRLWSPEVARSDPVLGRTVGAYLWAGVDLGFVVAFYLLVSGLEGWWTPSEALVDPDLLATPLPWLSAVALSLFAAFWEESLFRAVPLAGATLLGRRFGGTRAWVGAALLLQALVFAAAHANYAQQPPYARVVELFLPALAWGVIYLLFGLLPVILIHFLHNVTLLSLPLFTSGAAGLWPDRVVLVAVVAVPVAVVLVARGRRGARTDAPDDAYNGAWSPAEGGGEETEDREQVAAPGEEEPAGGRAAVRDTDGAPHPLGRRGRVLAAVAGLAGLVAWAWATDFTPDVPDLAIGKETAVEVARTEVREAGADLGEPWRALPYVDPGGGEDARFVWQEARDTERGGAKDGSGEAFFQLLGAYLDPPHWHVRFARFTGSVEERAEEWEVEVDPDGGVQRRVHTLPEARPGASLAEDEALALARRALRDRLDPEPARLREVSADAMSRPERRDWTFVYADEGAYPLDEGEARIEVKVAGDEVVDVRRYVHVPERWERQEEARRNRRLMVGIGSGGILGLVLLAAAVWGVVLWSRRGFALRAFLGALAVVGGTGLVTAANEWPGVMARLSTAQPLGMQVFIAAAALGLVLLFISGTVALAAGMAHTWRRPRPPAARGAGWIGAAVGAGLAGAAALAEGLRPSLAPHRPSFGGAEAYVPAVSVALDPLLELVVAGTLLLVMVVATDRLTDGWRRRRAMAGSALLLVGIAVAGTTFDSSLGLWLGAGVVAGALLLGLYHVAARAHVALVPPLAGAGVVLDQVERTVESPFPGSGPGALAACVLVAALALLWSRELLRAPPGARPWPWSGAGGDDRPPRPQGS